MMLHLRILIRRFCLAKMNLSSGPISEVHMGQWVIMKDLFLF